MTFGKLTLNPATNPGVLDTETWDVASAAEQLCRSDSDWLAFQRAAQQGAALPALAGLRLWEETFAHASDGVWVLAGLPDGQSAFCCIGCEHPAALPGESIAGKRLNASTWLTAFRTDALNLDRFCRALRPDKGPRALGAIPRLGIGTRMTTQVWPGIFDAMTRQGLAANAIQNSIRELSLLEDLLAALPPETNYSTGIGQIETGWTGSTYEGLWVAGVLAALRTKGPLRYGADADHIQVKRGPAGIERAKRILRAARYYSFYTLDMADVLNYAALDASSTGAAGAFLAEKIPDATERRGIVAHHTAAFAAGHHRVRLTEAVAGRLVGKYWDTLNTVSDLAGYLASLRNGVPFDLELTIDEHPPEVAAFDCLTTSEEVLFLAREVRRRGLPITHLAPNFGQEKGYDYRCPDGLEGLESRVRVQFAIASEFGLLLDVHSGDDLSPASRRVFGRATGGQVHFKVSPMLQLIYARLLQDFHPGLFARWWEDALIYARREAARGSPVAREDLAAFDASPDPRPSPRHKVFHDYSFPFVGRRDQHGQFRHREEFYRLSPQFGAAYQQEVSAWLCQLAEDVFPM